MLLHPTRVPSTSREHVDTIYVSREYLINRYLLLSDDVHAISLSAASLNLASFTDLLQDSCRLLFSVRVDKCNWPSVSNGGSEFFQVISCCAFHPEPPRFAAVGMEDGMSLAQLIKSNDAWLLIAIIGHRGSKSIFCENKIYIFMNGFHRKAFRASRQIVLRSHYPVIDFSVH